jgi:aspartyl-tRNA(Asn)/glutamyl-tRNA(Gln) amidotransferase subunit B
METRSFDAVNGTTFSLRSKEKANDYRYFPEPDLSPFMITENYISKINAVMPPLPEALHTRFTSDFGLSEYDAGILTDSKPIALYFSELTSHTNNYKAAANWMNGPVKSYLNERALEMHQFPLKAKTIAEIIALIDSGKMNFSAASQKLFPYLTDNPEANPQEIAEKNNWIQEDNSDSMNTWIEQAIARFPDKVAEYKSGKTGLVGLFMGEVMKLSQGKADPKKANQLVRDALDKA